MIENDQELENTRKKLEGLEELRVRTQQRLNPNPSVREWTLRSIANRMKRMREEIHEYESRVRQQS